MNEALEALIKAGIVQIIPVGYDEKREKASDE
jgi:hypothetical protein